MFLTKVACRAARVLDMDDCPLHGLIHDPINYPLYYDPIYYPEIYPEYFIYPDNSAAWLESDLNLHISTCRACQNFWSHCGLSVRWNAPFFEFQVVCGNVARIPLSLIENSTYVRCHILQNIFSQLTSTSVTDSFVKRVSDDVPSWLLYDDNHYQNMLMELSASVLQEGNTLCLPLISQPKSQRNKASFVANILSLFKSECAKLVSLSDDDFLTWRIGHESNRHRAFADYFTNVYGKKISSIIRELPFELLCSFQIQNLQKFSNEILWLNESLEELVKRLEKYFHLDILLAEIKKIPVHRRPVIFTKSRGKSANSLADHVRRRVAYLATKQPSALLELILSLDPHWYFKGYCVKESELITHIITCEYGTVILNAISNSVMVSNRLKKETQKQNISDLNKKKRSEEKVKKIHIKKDLDLKIESDWPALVPKQVILQSLMDYREGTIWKEPPVCAVCAQYSEKIFNLSFSENECPLDLEILRLNDPFIQKCVTQNNPSEFVFHNIHLNNLILEKKGIEVVSQSMSSLTICNECYLALKKSKMPRFALANKIYRGCLPEQFNDLTWVEEMVCAIYRNTAHITRLYGSSDPAQPTILHGNTCAHDMNVVSTASVLPRTPADINNLLSIVFIGAGILKPESLRNMFRVRKSKICNFLLWLKINNRLYIDLPFDKNLLDLYPEDGILPGLEQRIFQDSEIDPDRVFSEETAGFMNHPAATFRIDLEKTSDFESELNSEIMLEKMGVADPESEKIGGRTFTASALRNLVKDLRDVDNPDLPDLVFHHGQVAICEYNNPDLMPGMFPTLYPFGVGGFEDKSRQTQLSFQQQAQYYFNIPDRSFRYHYSFIFVALNIWQRKISHLHTHFTVQSSKFESVAQRLIKVSSETLSNLATSLENEKPQSEFSQEQKSAYELLKQTNSISSRIPGSQSSKIFIRNEIRNYFGYFGLPQIYFTFNPSAANSPIFQVMFGDKEVDLMERFPKMPSSRERALRLAKDPVAAANFFEFSFQALFKYLFGWNFETRKSNETGGIIGKLRAFFGTSELTERGSFHGHFLIWFLGGLNPSELHKKLTTPEYEHKFFAFFESIIRHDLPDVEVKIDSSYEPRIQRPPISPNPSDKTPIDILNEWDVLFATEVKMCGEVLQRHICRAVCHKYGNEGKCRFLFPHEIVEASYFDAETNSVVLVCRDATVNYHNPYILVFCRHNHDIKCILSGKSAKAAMFYITDYITKMDLKTYQSLSLLSRAVSRMPDISQCSTKDAAKTLLHKCLSQFTRQQQVHAQQAVRYLQGFGDGISSHKTTPMLSSLLLNFVREHYSGKKNNDVNSFEEDPDMEPMSLRIQTDSEGTLIAAHQVHHYWYRSDTLKDMSFYDFCRFVRLEHKSFSERNKNTSDTRLGVLHRHQIKEPHPFASTHNLLEHTNVDRGEGHELIPRVVGMSIPRESSPNWAIFVLSHFKPFSVDDALVSKSDSFEETLQQHVFCLQHRKIIENWNAIYECEDERDADRLRKQQAQTLESKAMTASIAMPDCEEGPEIISSNLKDHRKDFMIQQFVLMLQQSNWLTNGVDLTTKDSQISDLNNISRLHFNKQEQFTIDGNRLKLWQSEIKFQENTICQQRKNNLNLDNPTNAIDQDIKATENAIVISSTFDIGNTETEAPYLACSNSLTDNSDSSNIIEKVGDSFKLNEKQGQAFRIISNNFIDKCIKNLENVKPLHMLMTGPGGTGKTHVVKAVKEVMRQYASAHKIRFLAPTGSAASLIDGMTVHKGLGIKIAQNDGRGKSGRAPGESTEDCSALVTIQNKTKLRDEWRNVEVVLLDECSLLSEQILCDIDQALRYGKENPHEWFGGIIMIFSGDFFQYPPVMGAALYTPISLYGKHSEDNFKKRFGRMAWKTVDTVVELVEQHRMKSDIEYANAVLRLRTRECNIADVELFNSRLIKSLTNPNGIDMSAPENDNASVIVQINSLREVLNMSKAKSICRNTDRLVICCAKDIHNTTAPLTIEDYKYLLHLDFTSSKIKNSLPGFLPLFLGMPVILRMRNLSTDLKVANGSQGYVRHIVLEVLPNGLSHCVCALVEFPQSPIQLSGLPKGYYPVTPTTFTFTTTLARKDEKLKIKITRHQLPIHPAFAITGHSAQGKSIPKTISSLHEGGFAAYVAASRAFNREGLCITHRVQLKDLNKPLPHDLFIEHRRIISLQHNTSVRYGFIKGELIDVPDAECEKNIDFNVQLHTVFVNCESKKRKATTDDNAHEDFDEKKPAKLRKSVSLMSSSPPLKKSLLSKSSSVSHSTSSTFGSSHSGPFLSGCKWSSENYSCAYDSAFMTLFSIYSLFDIDQQAEARNWLNRFDKLGDSFQFLCQPNMQNTENFNNFRDQLRDYLSAHDPQDFRRYGPYGASVDLIFEHFLPRENRHLSIYGHCINCGLINLNFEEHLLQIVLQYEDRQYHNHISSFVSLKEHLRIWTDNLTDPYRNARSCCGSAISRIVPILTKPPLILFFDVQTESTQNYTMKIVPARLLTFPSITGNKTYILSAIVYIGDFHFSSRMILANGSVWTHDGRVNFGRPILELREWPDSMEHFLKLDGRAAHIYIYRLLDQEITMETVN